MASSLPLQAAETIQTAHINHNPSAEHDINPSTAASKKEPVTVESTQQQQQHASLFPDDGIDGDSVEEDDDDDDEDDEDIPYSVLRPKPRRAAHLPPLPDLRYEQSYLHSIRQADTWGKVLWITARDQIMMPFAQGILYNLGICGWQYWNKTAQLSGSSVGARVRRWWWGVNNWPIPREKGSSWLGQQA
ncbi:hypothetical protein B0T26DRAFT_641417 [Lasiosphaeria miniovina]|uniref:DUF1770-domain-containing protein n=1 Tax=Lasiosphaeria miniovina TaxID=1954250 RepID=A0AA40AUS9_9PEZI|nr:uncharacterized protein B0T26DRAFT_641417 [Lasiosphaeria miniovina]KAK0722339.1 hypothetical protein B0T26DRAFT_641417 [Lasiosphaeria miniovina]